MSNTIQSGPDVLVDVRGVSKVFKDFWGRRKAQALAGIDFQVRRGEVFGLLGPNGSGKSTTMKMLLGLLRPTAGELRVFDRPPQDVQVKARIGFMPEESYLYPYLTAAETLELYARLLDLPPGDRTERMAQLLEMIGLTHARGRAVGEFSKGMARRISLAQALLNDPDLILLDEPTSGLDPIGCRQFKDLILKLAARGKTILLCSHLLADVEDVCDSIAILYDGRICAQGRVRDMLEESHVCRLTVAEPSPAALADLLALLRQKLGAEPAVDHPSRSLENLFLATIEKAQAARGAEHSGAHSREALAPFLSGDSRRVSPDTAAS